MSGRAVLGWWGDWLRRIWSATCAIWEDSWLLIVGAAAALLLGAIGLDQYYEGKRDTQSLLYQSIQLFVFQMGDGIYPVPPALDVARFLAPFVAATTTIRALWPFLRQQVLLSTVRDHAIICGLGRKGHLLADGFRRRGCPVVIVERDPSNPLLGPCRDLGAVPLIGDASSAVALRKAGIERAKYLLAVTDDDGTNAEAVLQARAIVGDGAADLVARAHVVDPQLCELFYGADTGQTADQEKAIPLFNVLESGARVLLSQHPILAGASLRTGRGPRLLVVGLGYLGEGLVVQAARDWRRRHGADEVRLPITVVDLEAERKVESLQARHPLVEQMCELEPLAMDVGDPDFQRGAMLFGPDGDCRVTSVYVCLGDDSASLTAGRILRRRLGDQPVPVVVSMTHHPEMAKLVLGAAGQADGLTAFDLFARTCTPELLVDVDREDLEALARAVHDEYRRGLQQQGRTGPADRPWEDLDQVYRDSSRRQVDHLQVKLAAINCFLAKSAAPDPTRFAFRTGEVEQLAEMEHERWIDERLVEGWTYGQRDEARKTNPYLVAWDELSEDVKEYDRNAVRRLPELLAKVGLEIVRQD